MREHKINLYSFAELSEEAREKAHADFLGLGLPVSWGTEYRATLQAFEDLFHTRVHSWYVDQCGYSFQFVQEWQWDDGTDIFDDPRRFARWAWNNLAEKIKYPKIYGRLIPDPATGKTLYKRHESKISYTLDGLNLTDFCADVDITAPIADCLHYKRKFCCAADLLSACLDSFFTAWQKEYEYEETREYFEDMCAGNDWEFLEDGTFWRA